MNKKAQPEQRHVSKDEHLDEAAQNAKEQGKGNASYARAAAILRAQNGLSILPNDAYELSRAIGNNAMLSLLPKREAQVLGGLELYGTDTEPCECPQTEIATFGALECAQADTTAFPAYGIGGE